MEDVGDTTSGCVAECRLRCRRGTTGTHGESRSSSSDEAAELSEKSTASVSLGPEFKSGCWSVAYLRACADILDPSTAGHVVATVAFSRCWVGRVSTSTGILCKWTDCGWDGAVSCTCDDDGDGSTTLFAVVQATARADASSAFRSASHIAEKEASRS